MKDIKSVGKETTMATTTLNRISGLNFTPVFAYSHSTSYSPMESYPDHTDWGPTHPNADELAAAYAITQLRSRSRMEGMLDQKFQREDLMRSASDVRCSSSNPNTAGVIKTEPADHYEERNGDSPISRLNCSKRMKEAEEVLSSRRCVAAEGGHYVRTCLQADVSRISVNSLGRSTPEHHSSSAAMSSRIPRPITFTERSDATCMGQIQTGRGHPYDKALRERHTERVYENSTPQSRSGARSCDVPSLLRISSSQLSAANVSPNISRVMESADARNSRFERHSANPSPLCSPELGSPRRKQTSEVRPLQRFDSPTSLLRKRVQYNIEQARRRYLSDDSGLVRHRILKGIFGSLSAIEIYYKQLDKSGNSRLPLDDSAIDLSIRKRVNKRRLSDDDLTAQRAIKQSVSKQINDETGRETPELALAFNRCDLRSTKLSAADNCRITTSQLSGGLKLCRSEPHSLCDLDTTRTDISVPGTTAPLYNPQTIIAQCKSVDNVKSELLCLKSEVKELNFEDKKTYSSLQQLHTVTLEEGATSRKSRSPTFHLPDSQLPPKKRRMFGHCWDDVAEKKEDNCEEMNKVNKINSENNHDKIEVESHGVGVSDTYHVLAISQSRENLLSAVRPDEDGDMPLHIAVVQGSTDVVKRILTVMNKLEISIDSCNNQKQTALHLAAITNQPEVLKLLLDAGASPYLVDRNGNGVTHLAVRHNSLACLSSLLERCHSKKPSGHESEQTSLDLNVRNFEGVTPLQLAVQCNQFEALLLLIRYGADINAQEGKNGRTALYFAAELGDLRTTRVLLENGADCALLSYSGCSPAQVASGLSHLDLLQLLESYGSLNR